MSATAIEPASSPSTTPLDDLGPIQDYSFLGEEFLTWVAFRTDTEGSALVLPRSGEVDVWIDDRLMLTERGVENPAETSVKGGDPARAPETRAALVGGKMLGQARLGIRKMDREWSCSIDQDLLMRGLKLPVLLTDEEDEKLFERLALLEEAAFVLDELFELFCIDRFSDAWDKTVVPAMRDWVAREGRPAASA